MPRLQRRDGRCPAVASKLRVLRWGMCSGGAGPAYRSRPLQQNMALPRRVEGATRKLEGRCDVEPTVATAEKRMAKASVRNWLKGTALATDFGVPLRKAAEFVFKWGTNVPRAHPLNVHAQRVAEAIRDETNGRF